MTEFFGALLNFAPRLMPLLPHVSPGPGNFYKTLYQQVQAPGIL